MDDNSWLGIPTKSSTDDLQANPIKASFRFTRPKAHVLCTAMKNGTQRIGLRLTWI